jgi:hypothetical protein
MNNYKDFSREQIESALELTVVQRDTFKRELDRLHNLVDVIIRAAIKDD